MTEQKTYELEDVDPCLCVEPTAKEIESIFGCRAVRLHGDSPWSYDVMRGEMAAVLVRGADIRVLLVRERERLLWSSAPGPEMPRRRAYAQGLRSFLIDKAKTFWNGRAKFPGEWKPWLEMTEVSK